MFDDWGDVVQPLLVGGICGTVGPWLGARVHRRRLRRQVGEGRTWLAVRAVGSAHSGLSTRWRQSTARPADGRLELSRWLIGGLDLLVVDVLAVSPDVRDLRVRESLFLGGVLDRKLLVATPGGPVEVAVGHEQLEWLRARLTGLREAP